MNVKFLDIKDNQYETPKNLENKKLKEIPDLFDAGKINNDYLVFSPLLQRIFLFDEKSYNYFRNQKMKDREILELAKISIFVENPNFFLPNKSTRNTGKFLDEVTVFLTTRCNLRCRYCYASGGENPYDIDFNFVKIALNSLNRQHAEIGFHGGGEPFQAFSLMKRIVDYAKKRIKNISLNVQTNGMLTHEQIEWILNNKVSVTLSSDGPPLIQNVQRPMVENKPSSIWLENTLKTFGETDFIKEIGVRTTISNFSVNKTKEIVDYFHKFGIKNLHFEPLFEQGRALKTKISAPDINDYIKNFLAALELAESYGINLKCTLLPIGKKISFCGASGSNFSLTTDGYISACHEASCGSIGPKIFIYGKYDDKKKKIVTEKRKLDFLKTRTIFEMKPCQKCIAKWGCAGGCLIKCFLRTGNLFKPYTDYCTINKQTLENYIKYRAEKDLIKIKPYIEKSNGEYFYQSFFERQRMDVIENDKQEFKQSRILVRISASKTNFNRTLKNILSKSPRVLLSFHIKASDLNSQTKDKIVKFLENLEKNKIDFRVNKPLPKCLFGNEYRKLVEKFRIPTNCDDCFELFSVNQENNIVLCNNRVKKNNKINMNNVNDRNEIIKIFSENKTKISKPCDSCVQYMRRECNGLCF
jgi:uncharacterized protein